MVQNASTHIGTVMFILALLNLSGKTVDSFMSDPPVSMCDYDKVLQYMKTNTSATDDHAVLCADSTPRTSYALLYQACPGINYDYHKWIRVQKVEGDCTTLTKGQALINYYEQYALAGGVFVECINGTDIKVALQNCDPVHFLVVDNATLYESFIYTVLW